MSLEPTDVRSNETLGWIGLGVGVVGLAFTLRPQTHASGMVFWSVLVVGILAILVGGATVVAGRWRARRRRSNGRRQRHLVAVECERISDALAAFVAEQWRVRPRSLPFGSAEARLERWGEDVEARYRKNFRTWGLETFDEAERLGGVAGSSRTFVEAPSIEQLQQLPSLFRDAARSLERR